MAPRLRKWDFMGLAASLLLAATLPATRAQATVIDLKSGESAAEALSRAAPGDTIRLGAGLFSGDIVIDTPGVTLEGAPGAVLEGSGTGTTVWIKASDVIIRGLTIRG